MQESSCERELVCVQVSQLLCERGFESEPAHVRELMCRRAPVNQLLRESSCVFILHIATSSIRNDHTTMTAPLPVCSAKLSIVGPG